ncbi:MAG: hypothetical protein HY000_14290 [Planctomycetes bacterium]|nr:hypothetical protein [Planctomycetota bacterium]
MRLDKLPEGLVFPADLRKRISFDPVRVRLVYCGFMCKADFDRLANLSNDLQYRRALEQLFQISTEVEVPQLRRFRLVLVAMVIFCLALAAVVWWQLLRDAPRPPDVPEPSEVQSLFAPCDGSLAKVVDSPMHLSLPQMQRGSRTSVARCKDWMSSG